MLPETEDLYVNVTFPVGVPEAEETVVVKRMAWLPGAGASTISLIRNGLLALSPIAYQLLRKKSRLISLDLDEYSGWLLPLGDLQKAVVSGHSVHLEFQCPAAVELQSRYLPSTKMW